MDPSDLNVLALEWSVCRYKHMYRQEQKAKRLHLNGIGIWTSPISMISHWSDVCTSMSIAIERIRIASRIEQRLQV